MKRNSSRQETGILRRKRQEANKLTPSACSNPAEWGNILFLEGVPSLPNYTAGWRTSMESLMLGLDNGLVAKPARQPRISWLMAQKG